MLGLKDVFQECQWFKFGLGVIGLILFLMIMRDVRFNIGLWLARIGV